MRKSSLLLLIALVIGPDFSAMAQTAQVPPVPTGLNARVEPAGMYTSARLAWSAAPGPWLFRVYRSVDNAGRFQPLQVTSMHGYEDFMILPGHSYAYYVTALVILRDSTVLESGPSNIDSVLVGPVPDRPFGIIAGTVVDSLSGRPIPGVRMTFHRRVMSLSLFPRMMTPPAVWTDTAGRYRAVLDTGTYIINATPWLAARGLPQFVPEFYKDARVPEKAAPVSLAEKDSLVVPFDLARAEPPVVYRLSGTVRDTLGNPLANAAVAVLRSMQDVRQAAMDVTGPVGLSSQTIEGLGYCRGVVWSGRTDSLGRYSVRLTGGKAYSVAAVKRFYAPQFFDHKSSPDEADILVLGNDTTGIDFALTLIPQVNNSVAGSVVDTAGTGVPSHIILIPVRGQPAPLVVRFAETDSTGAFAISSVRAGKYFALAMPFDTYAPAFYTAGQFGVMRWWLADTIVANGDVKDIAIGVVPVRPRGVVNVFGTVCAAAQLAGVGASAPLPGASVYLVDDLGMIAGYGLTGSDGLFTLQQVAPGSYTVVADKHGYRAPAGSVTVNPMDFAVSVPEIVMHPEGTTGVEEAAGVPLQFQLEQNYPNPFNPLTVIRYTLAAPAKVSLKVYTLLGQEVGALVNQVQPAGSHQAVFSAGTLSSGVYFYRLEAGSFVQTRRMVLVR